MEIKKVQGVHLVRLRGSRRERAEQHGRLIAELSREDQRSLAYFPLVRKNQSLIRKATHRLPGVGRLMGGLYEALVLERTLRLPKAYRARIAPFVRASGIPLKKVWLSLYQPDFLMILAASSSPRNRNLYLQGIPGCSTARIFSGKDTYFLRTLDYPALSHWEKHTAVFFHEPVGENVQKYISVSSLGMQVSGITGWNESGIALSLHAHFSKKVSLRGVPIFFLGEDILEKARTLDEAIDLCRKFRPMGSWALNLTSFREGLSVTVELVGGEIFVRKPQDSCGIAHSNVFQSESFRKSELHLSGAYFEDSFSRKKTLEEAARTLSTDFTWSSAFSVLASHRDPSTGKKRLFGNVLSSITGIQSVGFDPAERCIHLSTRTESPVTHGPYLRIPIDFDSLPAEGEWPTLNLPSTHSSEFLKALHLYHQAYVSWQVLNEDAKVAHALLIQAVELLPEDPHLQMQRGYFELIHGQSQEAWNSFDRALAFPLSDHLRQVALYFRACSADLLGKRESAIEDCRAILAADPADRRLAKRAKMRLNSPFLAAHCQRILPDLQFAEPLNYP